MNKDFSKLRPFDPEAAKAGALVCWGADGQLAEFIGERAQNSKDVCIKWLESLGSIEKGSCGMAHPGLLRMAPLAWARKSADDGVLWPVYKGDVLYWDDRGVTKPHIADSLEEKASMDVIWQESGDAEARGYLPVKLLTFTPPKPRLSKMLCYFTGIELRWLAYGQGVAGHWKRVPAEDKIIEVEE